MARKTVFFVMLIMLMTALSSYSDIITTRNGRELVGTYTEQGDKIIVTYEKKGKSYTEAIPRSDIASIEKITLKEKYKQKADAIDDKDPIAHENLSKWCAGHGMEDEAKAELKKAYRLRKAKAGFDDIDKILELADWCIRKGLLVEGKLEVETALDLDPKNEKAKALMQKIKSGGDKPGKDPGKENKPVKFVIPKNMKLITRDFAERAKRESDCDFCKGTGVFMEKEEPMPDMRCNSLIGKGGKEYENILFKFEKDWETDKNCVVLEFFDKESKPVQVAGVFYKILKAVPVYMDADNKITLGTQQELLLSRIPVNAYTAGVYSKTGVIRTPEGKSKEVDIVEKYEEDMLFISDEDNDLQIVINNIKDSKFETPPGTAIKIGISYVWEYVFVDENGKTKFLDTRPAMSLVSSLVVDEETKTFHTLECLLSIKIVARGEKFFFPVFPKGIKGKKLPAAYMLPYWKIIPDEKTLSKQYAPCEKCILE